MLLRLRTHLGSNEREMMCGVYAMETAPGATIHPAEHAVDAPALGAIRKLDIERLSGSA